MNGQTLGSASQTIAATGANSTTDDTSATAVAASVSRARAISRFQIACRTAAPSASANAEAGMSTRGKRRLEYLARPGLDGCLRASHASPSRRSQRRRLDRGFGLRGHDERVRPQQRPVAHRGPRAETGPDVPRVGARQELLLLAVVGPRLAHLKPSDRGPGREDLGLSAPELDVVVAGTARGPPAQQRRPGDALALARCEQELDLGRR